MGLNTARIASRSASACWQDSSRAGVAVRIGIADRFAQQLRRGRRGTLGAGERAIEHFDIAHGEAADLPRFGDRAARKPPSAPRSALSSITRVLAPVVLGALERGLQAFPVPVEQVAQQRARGQRTRAEPSVWASAAT